MFYIVEQVMPDPSGVHHTGSGNDDGLLLLSDLLSSTERNISEFFKSKMDSDP